jgi:hypothetical protein
MGQKCSSETSVDFSGLHGVISQKTEPVTTVTEVLLHYTQYRRDLGLYTETFEYCCEVRTELSLIREVQKKEKKKKKKKEEDEEEEEEEGGKK